MNKIRLIKAEKNNLTHKENVLLIRNKYSSESKLYTKKIPLENHDQWWNESFDGQKIHIIYFNEDIIGYIWLNKANQISIALHPIYINKGIGTIAYKEFEKMSKTELKFIKAEVSIDNNISRRFFEKNGFILFQIINDEFIEYKKVLQ